MEMTNIEAFWTEKFSVGVFISNYTPFFQILHNLVSDGNLYDINQRVSVNQGIIYL